MQVFTAISLQYLFHQDSRNFLQTSSHLAPFLSKSSTNFVSSTKQGKSELEKYTGTFPRSAVESATEQQTTITPKLLEILSECKNNLEDLLDDSKYFLHIYAFYLLAQFQEKAAYPLIIEFFSVPGDITLDVTGDLVTEDLDRIIASVFDGNLEPVKQLIENREANIYVRSAALGSLLVLVAQKIISRELVIQYFAELFSTKLKKEPDDIWAKLVIKSCKLCAIELKQYIDEAFELNLISKFFIDQEIVDDVFEEGIEVALSKLHNNDRYSLISNTVMEMESWSCFRKETRKLNYSASPSSEGFTQSFKPGKAVANKKKKMQKEARRKNRTKKK